MRGRRQMRRAAAARWAGLAAAVGRLFNRRRGPFWPFALCHVILKHCSARRTASPDTHSANFAQQVPCLAAPGPAACSQESGECGTASSPNTRRPCFSSRSAARRCRRLFAPQPRRPASAPQMCQALPPASSWGKWLINSAARQCLGCRYLCRLRRRCSTACHRSPLTNAGRRASSSLAPWPTARLLPPRTVWWTRSRVRPGRQRRSCCALAAVPSRGCLRKPNPHSGVFPKPPPLQSTA